MGNSKATRVRAEIAANDPPVEIGSIWRIPPHPGKDQALRRIRILAKYPSIDEVDPSWIYEELPSKMIRFKLETYRLGKIPEFNLRYAFEQERLPESE
jgi:hypothetical protein